MNEGSWDNKNYGGVSTLFLLTFFYSFLVLIVFSKQDNAFFLHLESLKEQLVLDDLSCLFKHKQDIFFCFLAYKTLRAIVRFFFFKFFPIIFFWWKIYFFLNVFIYKRLNFCFSLWIFFDFSWFNTTVIENICYLFQWWDLLLLFCFLSNQENQYTIQHDLWHLWYNKWT